MPNVQWRTPDDGQRNCPKNVEFLDKNKFGKISASVGFIKNEIVRDVWCVALYSLVADINTSEESSGKKGSL